MEARPLVSVCVTTRNQIRYIEQCIASVLSQQGDFDLEVLVGDDASDDGTSEVIASIAARHRGLVLHVRQPRRLGPSANTKTLVARAAGAYIARLDGDDYWLDGKIARQLEALREAPECSAVYTNAVATDETGRSVGVFNDAGDIRINMDSLLGRGNFLNNSSMLCRSGHRAAWLAIPEPVLDYMVHLTHAHHGDILHLRTPMVVYRMGAKGSMVRESSAHVRDLYWRAICMHRGLVGDGTYGLAITDFLRRIFFRSVRDRDPRLFLGWARRVIEESPYGTIRTIALTLSQVVRVGGKILLSRLSPAGRQFVLYRT